MTGNRSRGLVLQARDRRLLTELGLMRVIDREQTKVVAGFGSTTRANTRLLALTRAGLLRRFFTGTTAGGRKSIYALTSKGAGLVGAQFQGINRGSDAVLVGDRFLEHQTRVNSIFVAVKYQPIPVPGVRLRRWISFRGQLSSTVPIIPDGYFELERSDNVDPMFLEVDLGSETQKQWRRKVEAYLQLAISGEFQRLFDHARFRVLIVTDSERRMNTIRNTVARSTDKIFWFSTFGSINSGGFWSPVWLRPRGDEKQPLV